MSTARDAFVPDEVSIFIWFEAIFTRGVRRPGYAADLWTEQFCLERFRQMGFEQVRCEAVTLPFWEPLEPALIVQAGGCELRVLCFSPAHSAPSSGLQAPLVPWRDDNPKAVRGALALADVPLLRPLPIFPCCSRVVARPIPHGADAIPAAPLPTPSRCCRSATISWP